MNKTDDEENAKYLNYLALKRQAVKEIEFDIVTRMESEIEYIKEENRYMREGLEKWVARLRELGYTKGKKL